MHASTPAWLVHLYAHRAACAGRSYVGCYAEADPRSLPNRVMEGGATTVDACQRAAMLAGYSVFGVQYGKMRHACCRSVATNVALSHV